jgi:hypothetical protein
MTEYPSLSGASSQASEPAEAEFLVRRLDARIAEYRLLSEDVRLGKAFGLAVLALEGERLTAVRRARILTGHW